MHCQAFIHLKSKSNLDCKHGSQTRLSHIIVIRPTDWYLGQFMNAVVTSVFDRVSTDSTRLLCCQPCSRRQGVRLPCGRAPFLSKQRGGLAEGAELRSRTVISVNGGLLQMKQWLCNAQWGQARLEAPSGSLLSEWDACCLMGWEERVL